MSTYTIPRNEQSKSLTEFEIVKGKKVGRKYYAPTFSIASFDDDVEWCGKDVVSAVMQRYLKATYQSIYFGCFNKDTGEFNEPQFLKEAETFTSSAMTIAQLDKEIDEATGEQQLLIRTAPVDPNTGMFLNPDDMKKIRELADQLTALRAAKENRSRKGKEDEEEEPSVASRA